jgi:hypothetical protein
LEQISRELVTGKFAHFWGTSLRSVQIHLPYKISIARLKELQSAIHFVNDGDGHEQASWSLFSERFPNLERFWQRFIVPMTKRIELDFPQQGRHERRDGIAEDLWMTSYLHYSTFMHLVYAAQHLQQPMLSSFGDFYSHLGSACDLTEDFLCKAYLLVLFCKAEKSKTLQGLSKPEFLAIASILYDTRYPKLYEHYYSKGKGFPLKIPARPNIVGEYFRDDESWMKYRKFSDTLRTYRNRIVHDVLIGEILDARGAPLVPKRERISSYQKLSDVFAAAGSPEKLKADFILMREQTVGDYAELQARLNALWARPLADMDFLFQSRNPILLEKYNLSLSD